MEWIWGLWVRIRWGGNTYGASSSSTIRPGRLCQIPCLSILLKGKVRALYRWLATSKNTHHKHQHGLLSQNFIFFQFPPVSPGTSFHQLEQFISLGCCKNWYLFFFKRGPELSENMPMDIHCNIRNNKGVLSYTTAIINMGTINKKTLIILICVYYYSYYTHILFVYVSIQMKNTLYFKSMAKANVIFIHNTLMKCWRVYGPTGVWCECIMIQALWKGDGQFLDCKGPWGNLGGG